VQLNHMVPGRNAGLQHHSREWLELQWVAVYRGVPPRLISKPET
jgi:hypothetical protein